MIANIKSLVIAEEIENSNVKIEVEYVFKRNDKGQLVLSDIRYFYQGEEVSIEDLLDEEIITKEEYESLSRYIDHRIESFQDLKETIVKLCTIFID